MNEQQTIDLLRFALAAIWTECESENPNLEHVQQIANEAINFTIAHAKRHGYSTSTGLESWTEYKSANKV